MTSGKKQATAATVAQRNSTHALYGRLPLQASTINDVLAQLLLGLETRHHGPYERMVVVGKSLRAAVNGFRLECVGWRIEEIRRCTDLACALWDVRPYQDGPQNSHDGHSVPLESTNSKQGGHRGPSGKGAV